MKKYKAKAAIGVIIAVLMVTGAMALGTTDTSMHSSPNKHYP